MTGIMVVVQISQEQQVRPSQRSSEALENIPDWELSLADNLYTTSHPSQIADFPYSHLKDLLGCLISTCLIGVKKHLTKATQRREGHFGSQSKGLQSTMAGEGMMAHSSKGYSLLWLGKT